MNTKYLSILLFFIFLISSCQRLMIKSYGIKKNTNRSMKQIQKFAKKYQVPQVYTLKHTMGKFLDSLDKKYQQTLPPKKLNENACATYYSVAYNHNQPLQVSYYNKEGKLIAFDNNCYAGGFPNLNWRFKTQSFPPEFPNTTDSIFTRELHLNFIDFQDSEVPNLSSFEYVVIVHWNIFMGRQSKRMLNEIKNKYQNRSDIKFIFVNNDNSFAASL